MNTETSSNGTTRRSFIKRSVVAAVAVSTMTIFSGLVNAQTPAASGTGTGGQTPCKSGTKTRCCIDKFGTSDNGYTCSGSDSSGYYCDRNGNNATYGTCPPDPPKP
jgi:hypothetical protein